MNNIKEKNIDNNIESTGVELKKIQEFLNQSLKIRNLTLKNRLALAPLAGTTEVVFRSICSGFGVGLTTTELVSARGIFYDQELQRNFRYLEIDPIQENAVAIQLFGHDPSDFSKATQTILEHPLLGQCSMLDINMGCPVNKVVKQGAGSALMKTPELAQRIVDAVAKQAIKYNKPVSVKIRSGWDCNSINAPVFAKLMEQAGADLITVHARTRTQMYSGLADWDIIKAVVQEVNIPVYGNGDLMDIASIKRMYKITNCDGFAIGRAAQGNPWIFSELLTTEQSTQSQPFIPEKQEWLDIIDRHLSGLIRKIEQTFVKKSLSKSSEKEITPETIAIKQMRAQLADYLKGRRHAAKARSAVMNCKTKAELFEILKNL